MLTIESRVPCDAVLYAWLRLHDVELDNLVRQSHRYERAYLAWETVRQMRNPFFKIGTGFEGYFVGIAQSPEQILAYLVEIGHGILRSNCRMYRHQYTFQAKLMKTLRGELNDPRAINVLSSLLGATLSKLRCHVYYNHKTYLFQNETYWAVNRIPFVNYALCEHHIEQKYTLPLFKDNGVSKLDLCLNMFKPSDYDAGMVVTRIGRFGHPLTRAYLQEVDRFRA